MHELIALSRLALLQHRWVLAFLIAAVLCGQLVLAVLLAANAAPANEPLAMFAILISLLPAGFAAVLLFDFAHGGDMGSPASGCSHWLLRMPIPAWKIAIVPVFLKTAWIAMIWLLLVFTSDLRFHPSLPLVAPCFLFSAAALWLMVIAWMPLRIGWHRFLWLSVLFVALYLMLGLVFGGPTINQVQWRPIATAAGLVLSLVLYVAAASAAVRTVAIARSSPFGITPERSRRVLLPGVVAGTGDWRKFASPLVALAWHELAKTQHWVIRSLSLGVLPVTLIFGLLVPLHPVAVGAVFVLFAYIAGFSVCGNAERPNPATGCTLPTFLVTSPLTSAQIAWTRLVVPLSVATAVFGCVVFVFFLWAMWPSNREVWLQWAAEQAASLDAPASAAATGVRLSVAAVLAAATLMLGRIAAFWWIGMSGRSWFAVLMTIISAAIVLVPFSLVLRWFMAQTQWTEVQAAFQSFLGWIPALAAGLLALKAVAVLMVSAALRYASLASIRSIVTVWLIWLAIMLVISSILAILIPHAAVSFAGCVAAASLAIPLARVLAMPLTLDWNRHR